MTSHLLRLLVRAISLRMRGGVDLEHWRAPLRRCGFLDRLPALALSRGNRGYHL